MVIMSSSVENIDGVYLENKEQVLSELLAFPSSEGVISDTLLSYLKDVAKTGVPSFQWSLIKPVLLRKLDDTVNEFQSDSETHYSADKVPPNVEQISVDQLQARVRDYLNKYDSAPFTIQRICDLFTEPKRFYKRVDRFLRAVEKNVLVVTTINPNGVREGYEHFLDHAAGGGGGGECDRNDSMEDGAGGRSLGFPVNYEPKPMPPPSPAISSSTSYTAAWIGAGGALPDPIVPPSMDLDGCDDDDDDEDEDDADEDREGGTSPAAAAAAAAAAGDRSGAVPAADTPPSVADSNEATRGSPPSSISSGVGGADEETSSSSAFSRFAQRPAAAAAAAARPTADDDGLATAGAAAARPWNTAPAGADVEEAGSSPASEFSDVLGVALEQHHLNESESKKRRQPWLADADELAAAGEPAAKRASIESSSPPPPPPPPPPPIGADSGAEARGGGVSPPSLSPPANSKPLPAIGELLKPRQLHHDQPGVSESAELLSAGGSESPVDDTETGSGGGGASLVEFSRNQNGGEIGSDAVASSELASKSPPADSVI